MSDITALTLASQVAIAAQALNATAGRQAAILGDGTAAGFDKQTPLTSLGTLNPGTYVFRIPSGGAGAIDVALTMTHTGTVPTATIVPTYLDMTAKGNPTAFGAFTDSTLNQQSITTLRGEQYTLLTITVPAASTATFTRAEYSSL